MSLFPCHSEELERIIDEKGMESYTDHTIGELEQMVGTLMNTTYQISEAVRYLK